MAEIPQSVSTDLGRTNLNINQRCGNCKHLKRIAHPAYEKVCKELGMVDLSKPCLKFSADPTKIKFTDTNARKAVEFLQDLSEDRLLLFASQIVEEVKSRRYGFSFGQTVYILAFGGDYLSNYRRMKVVSAEKKYINLVGSDGFTAMLFHKSVLTSAQWIKKKKWLIANERLEDPRYGKYTQSQTHAQMQLQRVKDKLSAQELDSTNRHEFAITAGVIKRSRFNDPLRVTSIDKLIRVR